MVTVAEGSGLTTYASAYLWLSRDLALMLVTLDRDLAAAAARI